MAKSQDTTIKISGKCRDDQTCVFKVRKESKAVKVNDIADLAAALEKVMRSEK
ncbi:MAG: hypothetical protein Q8R31_05865 [Candidatus Omnitrophota bacterium]|nr:hypothetical protein [Candidatus Omnitrophota bacterium]